MARQAPVAPPPTHDEYIVAMNRYYHASKARRRASDAALIKTYEKPHHVYCDPIKCSDALECWDGRYSE